MKIISILFLVSAIHGFFLVTIILTHGKRHILKGNIFLAMLLIIVSGYLLREYLYLEGYFELLPHLMAVFVPFLYLLGPIYYHYIQFSIDPDFRFRKVDLVHLLPAVVCFLIILPFYMKTADEKLLIYSAPAPGKLNLAPNRALFYGFMIMSWFYYAWSSLRLIMQKIKGSDNRSLKAVRQRLIWLKNYTWVFMFFLMFFLASYLLFIFSNLDQYYLMIGVLLGFSVLINFVGYWALRESHFTVAGTRVNVTNLPKDRITKLKEEIDHMMVTDKVYLDSNVTMQDFCQKLSINSNYLSQLVNREFDCSLTYLINSYRVEAAKEKLLSSDSNHLNFLGIATEVGFNTKNTFTRTFKRHTGVTPSEFRRLHKKELASK